MTSKPTLDDLRNTLNTQNYTGYSNILGVIQNTQTIDTIANLINNPNAVFYIPNNDALKNVTLSDLSGPNDIINIIQDHIVVGNCTLSGKILNIPDNYLVEAFQQTNPNGNPGAGFQIINTIINNNVAAPSNTCPNLNLPQ